MTSAQALHPEPAARSPRPRSTNRIGRALQAVVLAAVVTGAVLGTSADPAAAYASTSWSGRVGKVVAPAATVRSGLDFSFPGVTVYRNGAASYGQAQRFLVIYGLQWWNGSAWVDAGAISQWGAIQQGGYYATVAPISLRPNFNRRGYWRVQYAVAWQGSWVPVGTSPATGWHEFVPSAASDMRCGISTCRAYAGSVYVR